MLIQPVRAIFFRALTIDTITPTWDWKPVVYDTSIRTSVDTFQSRLHEINLCSAKLSVPTVDTVVSSNSKRNFQGSTKVVANNVIPARSTETV